MHRRAFLRTGTAVSVTGITGLAGCLGRNDEADFAAGFEDGLGEWESRAAIGPEVDPADFAWEVGVSGERAAEGEQSLRVWNEGDHDDGVTWATHEVPVEPGRAYDVRVSGQFWSESESFNTIRHAVMRLGPRPAEVEADFPAVGVNSTDFGETPYGGLREPLWLAEGWREYAFEWTTPELSTETLHVAVGTAVIWEADATHYVDDLTVTVEPR